MTMHIVDGAAAERAKYEEMWAVPEYSDISYGLENVERFMGIMKPGIQSTIIDIGCGSGKAGLAFHQRIMWVSWLDLTDAGLDDAIPREKFIQAPLWSEWAGPARWQYGYCCDVMEHIAPEYTMLCIDRCLTACDKVWFQIANVPDNFGHVIGKPLHLTVAPFDWWRDRIASIGRIIDARDLCGHSLFVVTR